MDALGITIKPLSPQRNHPISPTVPFPSNQYGEAGSRRDDIDEPQSFPIGPGRGMLGEVYWVMLPPPCLSSGWAAGKMDTERLRSGQTNTTSRETGPLCSYYHPPSSTSLQNMSHMSSRPRWGKNWLTCFNGRKIKVAVAKWQPAIGHSKGRWALQKHRLRLNSYRSLVNTEE